MEIPILRHLQTRNAVIAVSIVAGLVLLLAMGSVALEISGLRETRNISEQNPALLNPGQQASDVTVNEIVAAHLMGNPARARPVRVERAPTTKLNLTLKGLLSAHDQQMARAIIAIGKKPDKLYAVGDKLESGNAVVKEIREDGVILDRNGKLESLPLPKKLTSDNISADALYIPNTTEPAVEAANPMESAPVRRAAQQPNFSELDPVVQSMNPGSPEAEPAVPEDTEGKPEEE